MLAELAKAEDAEVALPGGKMVLLQPTEDKAKKLPTVCLAFYADSKLKKELKKEIEDA